MALWHPVSFAPKLDEYVQHEQDRRNQYDRHKERQGIILPGFLSVHFVLLRAEEPECRLLPGYQEGISIL
jgi:hypothetical protein